MKVLLINGSPHERGCTYTALCEVAGALNEAGVETELLHLGTEPIAGCLGCGGCRGLGRCVIEDVVNVALGRAAGADGYVFGSPVHYAAASGAITCFLDRFFQVGGHAYKPGAAVVSARRGGTTAALDQLNKYMTISRMPLVSSQYWNMVHGNTPEEVRQDLEGLQIMRTLGRNMAWLLRCIEAGRAAGIRPPAPEPERLHTNFIR
ncbi:MAG: flavodoxin family protein [Clostridiales bacterium]|nr:flavodoxin family protein [Clostridiales bacterium]